MSEPSHRSPTPWAWIPSLYVAEGLPYVLVAMSPIAVMYKQAFGVSNADFAFYTSWLYLPWVLKPLWSPVVELLGTRRAWVWATQLVMGGVLAGVALTLPGPLFFRDSLAGFWLLAFDSATHDIAADGFYLLGTNERQQAYFVGVRGTFYRVAMLLGQGPIVFLAGWLGARSGHPRQAWSLVLLGVGATLALLGLWHRYVLPRPAADRPGDARDVPRFVLGFLRTFGSFFRRPGIAVLLAFLLLYRLGEAQLVKMATPFLLDGRAQGGLALSTEQVGIVYGMVGVAALVAGGLLGGYVIARHGLGRWLWPMLFAIHLPDAAFLWLAWAQPTSLGPVLAGVALEQFGYGFGFTAYMMYMMWIARGPHPTAHYAICTGFMGLGMMVPGMWSGWLQTRLGYPHFFLWVLLATVPSFLVALALPLEPEFGRRTAA